MSYQVLARKYRPQRFEEVIGQHHVTQTLQNALEQKRIHHAYLFTGARGIGKTTVARILAKALNCEKGITKEPCNGCVSCSEILEGRSIDVQEIDGASNTGVDDVRAIREQTKYMPARARYKIYIIDEVHMLSTQAFNALLKTLEEPPPHVVFIFATTEAHKIPATILSRCQRYDFKRIPGRELVASLEKTVQKEGISCSKEALHLIAHESQGSLRDAQSLLDQAIAFAGKNIRYEDLKQMLGFLDKTQFMNLLEAVLKKEREKALEQLNLFYQTGSDLTRLAEELFIYLRTLFLIRSLNGIPDWLDLPKEELEMLERFSGLVDLEELDQMVSFSYRTFEEIARSGIPKILLEILLVRLTLVSKVVPLDKILERLDCLAPGDVPAPMPAPTKNLEAFTAWLTREKPQLASIVSHGRLVRFDETQVVLGFEMDSIYAEMLKEEDRKRQFEDYLKKFFNQPLGLVVTSLEAKAATAAAQTKQDQEREIKKKALTHEAVKEAVNILGAVVEEVVTDNEPSR